MKNHRAVIAFNCSANNASDKTVRGFRIGDRFLKAMSKPASRFAMRSKYAHKLRVELGRGELRRHSLRTCPAAARRKDIRSTDGSSTSIRENLEGQHMGSWCIGRPDGRHNLGGFRYLNKGARSLDFILLVLKVVALRLSRYAFWAGRSQERTVARAMGSAHWESQPYIHARWRSVA
jgi:hypothetical protein